MSKSSFRCRRYPNNAHPAHIWFMDDYGNDVMIDMRKWYIYSESA